jgi:hydrogenase maturation factor
MNLTGEQLAARFSCNCWTSQVKHFRDLLEGFARNGANYENAIKALKELASFAWYKIIAKKNNIDNPFDIKVVKAYWMGDENLVKPIKSNGNILLPFHNFTVLGDIHRYAGITVKDIDACKVSVAKVYGTKESQIDVSHRALIQRGKEFSLTQNPKIISIEKGFIGKVETGDWVVYHEEIVIDVLSEKEALAFIRRTEEAIKLFNQQQHEDPVI